MSTRRRRKSRDHRRGKSVEEISKEELMIIVDVDDLPDQLGGIQEDCDMDESFHYHHSIHSLSHGTNRLLSIDSPTSTDSGNMSLLLDEIDLELTSQYPTPPIQPDTYVQSQHSRGRKSLNITVNRRNRSDSHYAASTPLVVKKYTNLQLDSLVRSKKPQLCQAHDNLALLIDIVDEDERTNILLQKLSLCEVLCDFRIINDDEIDLNNLKIKQELQCIANKKLFLKECTKYLTKTNWSSIFILKQIFRTVQTNIFRSLPDSFIIQEFQGIDAPTKYTLPKWTHLQFIYELMFQVLMNKDIEKKTLCSYLSGGFLNNFVQLFHSLCVQEVDYVKILIHSMYLDFISLRDEIRICLSQYCWAYIYDNKGTSQGINAILDIMYSILQGLDDEKLNDPTKWYIVLCHVLCPLHKGENFDKFEATLYKCIKTFIRANPSHFVVVFNHGLLKFWPRTNPSKEHMFVSEILNVLKMVKRQKILCDESFTNVFRCVIKRIGKNLLSKHYLIVNETIDSFKEKLMRQCIEYHGGENGWKHLYKSLIYVTENHYLYLIRDCGKQMLDWLKKYRITKKYVQLFEKLENEYKTQSEQDKVQVLTLEKHRKQKWQALLIQAENGKQKLKEKKIKIKLKKQSEKQKKKHQKKHKKKQKKQEVGLAGAYMVQEKEFTSFTYPVHDNLFISDTPTHRITNSQPMPDPETPSKAVYKKRASQSENDYGYAKVHNVYKQYRETKSESCRKPTHLVLFAKHKGIEGITFAVTKKYFEARSQAKPKKKKRKKKKVKIVEPMVPSAILTSTNDKFTSNVSNENQHINTSRYRRSVPKADRCIRSPIIQSIKNEKEMDKKLKGSGTIEYTGDKANSRDHSPYWSALNIDSKELEGNTLKMEEIKEDTTNEVVSASLYEYAKDNNVILEDSKERSDGDGGGDNNKVRSSSAPIAQVSITPGSIKSSPMTPTASYWSEINKKELGFESLIANNISLK